MYVYVYVCYPSQKLPPVRGQAPRPPVNGLMKKKRKKKQEERPADGSGKDGRITSFDYRAWDKFDVVSLVAY